VACYAVWLPAWLQLKGAARNGRERKQQRQRAAFAAVLCGRAATRRRLQVRQRAAYFSAVRAFTCAGGAYVQRGSDTLPDTYLIFSETNGILRCKEMCNGSGIVERFEKSGVKLRPLYGNT
jgi:hypothetical protein